MPAAPRIRRRERQRCADGGGGSGGSAGEGWSQSCTAVRGMRVGNVCVSGEGGGEVSIDVRVTSKNKTQYTSSRKYNHKNKKKTSFGYKIGENMKLGERRVLSFSRGSALGVAVGTPLIEGQQEEGGRQEEIQRLVRRARLEFEPLVCWLKT